MVRRVKQGATWHPATDDFRGSDVYGTYGTPSSDSTFSIAWQGLGTELLLTTGARVCFVRLKRLPFLTSVFLCFSTGDLSLWALTDTNTLKSGTNKNPMNSHLGPNSTCKKADIRVRRFFELETLSRHHRESFESRVSGDLHVSSKA